MKQLEFTSFIPASIEDVWDFFSTPANLGKITPSSMNFEILTPVRKTIYPGMMIGYRVSPFPGMRVNWLTEITHISERNFFIDEQRVGPYKVWHHEHHFKKVNGGVEMSDILTYVIPLGAFGRMLDAVLIESRVRGIFAYREIIIKELFPIGLVR